MVLHTSPLAFGSTKISSSKQKYSQDLHAQHRAWIHDWQENKSQRARDKLVLAYTPLANRMARKWAKRGPSYDDLMQEAYTAICIAMDKFDLSYENIKFATYAAWWIRTSLDNYLFNMSEAISIYKSQHARQLYLDVKYSKDLNGETLKEIARRNNTEVKQVEEFVNMFSFGSLELNRLSFDGEDTQLEAVVDISSEDFKHKEEVLFDFTKIEPLLDRLPKRSADILRMRYLEEKTLLEVSEIYNVSRERIRQIEFNALNYLREMLDLPIVPRNYGPVPKRFRNMKKKVDGDLK